MPRQRSSERPPDHRPGVWRPVDGGGWEEVGPAGWRSLQKTLKRRVPGRFGPSASEWRRNLYLARRVVAAIGFDLRAGRHVVFRQGGGVGTWWVLPICDQEGVWLPVPTSAALPSSTLRWMPAGPEDGVFGPDRAGRGPDPISWVVELGLTAMCDLPPTFASSFDQSTARVLSWAFLVLLAERERLERLADHAEVLSLALELGRLEGAALAHARPRRTSPEWTEVLSEARSRLGPGRPRSELARFILNERDAGTDLGAKVKRLKCPASVDAVCRLIRSL